MTLPMTKPSARCVLPTALASIAIALGIRTWVASQNYFYWDDLILIGRGARFPLFSSELLLYDHDGHFMPAAFFLTGLVTRIAPYQWALPVMLLVLGQALASLALLRTLRLVLGWRPALLIPLLGYLFIPLTLPAFAWWSAALNALPLQIALAWVCGDAIQLVRTGRRHYAVSGTAVFVVSLLFFEKSVLVPFVALVFVVLYLRTQSDASPILTAAKKAKALWIPCAVVLAIWIPVYLFTVESPVTGNGRSMSTALLHHGTSLGMLPTLLGGPWQWERWIPGPAWANPPMFLVIAAWIMLLTALVVTVRSRQGAAWIWICAAVYFLASVAAMTVTRTAEGTTYELAQTLRYFTDSATVFALAIALYFAAPPRVEPRVDSHTTVPIRAIAVGLSVLFVVSSLVSTFSFVNVWRESPTRDYLQNARVSLAQNTDTPLLDQPVSIWVLLPFTNPNNMASQVLGPLPDRPEFASSTPILRLINDNGTVVDGEVTFTRRIPEGTDPQCGTRVDGPTELTLDGPLAVWDWTVQLNYLASADGTIDVSLTTGDAVSVPVKQGLHSAFVQVVGDGTTVKVAPRTPGLSLCLAAGQVGVVVPALP
ncbi:hypothetical protein KYT97_20355 [Rhodococcus globerulus]|nr:hypothetical protein KYT97_20355 [Rhodococcus globerulus]